MFNFGVYKTQFPASHGFIIRRHESTIIPLWSKLQVLVSASKLEQKYIEKNCMANVMPYLNQTGKKSVYYHRLFLSGLKSQGGGGGGGSVAPKIEGNSNFKWNGPSTTPLSIWKR